MKVSIIKLIVYNDSFMMCINYCVGLIIRILITDVREACLARVSFLASN
jgi:hypothetical protein